MLLTNIKSYLINLNWLNLVFEHSGIFFALMRNHCLGNILTYKKKKEVLLFASFIKNDPENLIKIVYTIISKYIAVDKILIKND